MARWNRKPPAGTQIDRSHPLGSRAASYYLCDDGVLLYDYAGGQHASPIGSTARRSSGPNGNAVDNSGGAYWNRTGVGHTGIFANSGNTLWWWGVPASFTTYGFFIGLRIAASNSYAIDTNSGALSLQWRDFFGWASGLTVTANADTFIVMSVQHQAVTAHLWTNGNYSTASTTDSRIGVVDPNSGTIGIGYDPFDTGRYVRGLIYGCGTFRTAFNPEQARAFRANPFDLFMPPVPRRSWFLPTSPPPPASSGNLLLLGVG